VNLTLESSGQVQSRNFYWLSTRAETLDWGREEQDTSGQYDISTWTPTKDFADYTALNTLPRITLEATAQSIREGNQGSTTVTVHNPSSTLAFAVRLKVDRPVNNRVSREGKEDSEILPVLWEDNYFPLLPGESRQVKATYTADPKNNANPVVEIEGWNVAHSFAKLQQ
jgi:exo-1,4-beta-D-glucosaminidase